MVYAISKLVEIELELKQKIKRLNRVEKSTSEEIISDIRLEYDHKLESIQEAIEILKDDYENTIY
jgi:hypothetical protein